VVQVQVADDDCLDVIDAVPDVGQGVVEVVLVLVDVDRERLPRGGYVEPQLVCAGDLEGEEPILGA